MYESRFERNEQHAFAKSAVLLVQQTSHHYTWPSVMQVPIRAPENVAPIALQGARPNLIN